MSSRAHFFSALPNKVAAIIERVVETDVDHVVVDLKQVSDIDSTGAQILVRMMDICRNKNKHMILSAIDSIRNSDALTTALSILKDQSVGNDRYRHCYFETIDDALGWVEDRLLEEGFGKDRYNKKIPLSGIDVLSRLSETDLNMLKHYLIEDTYGLQDVIVEQGTQGEQVYFIAQGKVQVIIDFPDGMGKNKIAALCPGTVFGGMAIIDRGAHSANVTAETDVVCYYLTIAALHLLNQDKPALAHQLMIGFAGELSKRIRIANRITTELKG